MNEVAEAFWNNENRFWYSERTMGVLQPTIYFISKEQMCCDNVGLVVEDTATVELDNDGVADVLQRFGNIFLLDLATHGVTEMRREVTI